MRPFAVVLSFVLAASFSGVPAAADPVRAVAFAKNIWPNVNFLDKSSRLAMTRARSRSLRAFAQSEAEDQTIAANAVAAWLDSVASQPGVPSPREARGNGSVIAMPFRAAANMTSGMADAIDGLQSGRSVAIDAEPAPTATIQLPEIKLSTTSVDLDRLSALHGRAFDAFYKTAQRDALNALSTLYASYIQNGGDAGLRNLAVRQLPKIDASLARLRTL